MSKIRFVLNDVLVLKRYYPPVLIVLELLRRMIPELPEGEEDAESFLRQNPNQMLRFLQWYYPDDSLSVTDPKGKGASCPEKSAVEEVKIQTQQDPSWTWLFPRFPEIEEETLRTFCEEQSIEFHTPQNKQKKAVELFEAVLSELKDAQVSDFEARNLFNQVFPEPEQYWPLNKIHALLLDSDINKVQQALDYLEQELTTPLSIEQFFQFKNEELSLTFIFQITAYLKSVNT